eukprot:CAMPEP_0206541608 /NCGR_PEP_ID=MMETSP0325_2-20121206/9710_1 /ASSEMBLY_ACC=CAM_ASM_000347 /TAXON_ID=2866 /ORGANISM="Crypthecodinium cohnii, Strain Seligo" /LENGTH=160 /DNA_ID=CAMNT_0054039571 /DNA_START=38 /DNA_END=517 /DNA_ORIENTATION=-
MSNGASDNSACVGEWQARNKKVMISEQGGKFFLEMGPEAPKLLVIPESAASSAWPKRWNALRQETQDLQYILEMDSAASARLLVRRPIGESVVEFERIAGRPEAKRGASKSKSKSRSNQNRRPGVAVATAGEARAAGGGGRAGVAVEAEAEARAAAARGG